MHDWKHYDAHLEAVRQRAAGSMQHQHDSFWKSADPRLSLIARGLQTAANADPGAMAGPPEGWVWAAAQLILDTYF